MSRGEVIIEAGLGDVLLIRRALIVSAEDDHGPGGLDDLRRGAGVGKEHGEPCSLRQAGDEERRQEVLTPHG